MSYNCLKILHIVSATLILTSMAYSIYLWRALQKSENPALILSRIQSQTWAVIMPFAFAQLMSGFTMISLQQLDFSQCWIKGSVISFIIGISSWFGFIYCLLLPQPSSRKESGFLLLCGISLLCMVFFMSTKVVTLYG